VDEDELFPVFVADPELELFDAVPVLDVFAESGISDLHPSPTTTRIKMATAPVIRSCFFIIFLQSKVSNQAGTRQNATNN
jgi:hypothetical protein